MSADVLVRRLDAHLSEYGDMRLGLREESPAAYRLYVLALIGVACA